MAHFEDSAPYDSLPSPDRSINRRSFMELCAACAAVSLIPPQCLSATDAASEARYRQPARFYQKLGGNAVQCQLCPRRCTVSDGSRGYCRARENRGGKYYTLIHSRIVAQHIDPIEKKPFFHFLPGTVAFSVASGGCNVNCKFCQNWEISQAKPEELRSVYYSPQELASGARSSSCPTIAYTYSEPVVWTEYVLDSAEAGHRQGVRSAMVCNGFINQEPLKELCGRLDALKVDLKSYSESYYRDVVRGELKPVLNTITTARKMAHWLEIVYLVVPTLNDSDSEFRNLARWMKAEIGTDVPIHFTRFHPLYLLKNLPPTPVETLERAKAIADAEGLQYAYIGNVPGHSAENTHCPKCRQLLIERAGYTIRQMNMEKGKCKKCGHSVPGVWS
jgi:pyruvate formate lyase activating enzyme